jgi:hypothetical protein
MIQSGLHQQISEVRRRPKGRGHIDETAYGSGILTTSPATKLFIKQFTTMSFGTMGRTKNAISPVTLYTDKVSS